MTIAWRSSVCLQLGELRIFFWAAYSSWYPPVYNFPISDCLSEWHCIDNILRSYIFNWSLMKQKDRQDLQGCVLSAKFTHQISSVTSNLWFLVSSSSVSCLILLSHSWIFLSLISNAVFCWKETCNVDIIMDIISYKQFSYFSDINLKQKPRIIDVLTVNPEKAINHPGQITTWNCFYRITRLQSEWLERHGPWLII